MPAAVSGGVSTIGVSTTSNGTVTVSSGTLEFDGPSNNFSGAVGGAGAVIFGNGSVSYLKAGASLSTAALSVVGSSTKLLLQTNIAYAGSFSHRIIGVNLHTGRRLVTFPHGQYVPVSGNGMRLLFNGFSRIYAVEPRASKRRQLAH